MEWRVPWKQPAVKFAGAAVFVVAGVLYAGVLYARDLALVVVAAVAAAALTAFAVRDLVAPVRLAAGPDGVTVVRGFAGRRHIAWSEIERIRVDRRTRLFGRSTLLEIDTGETLHFLSVHELGATPDEVADALLALRTGR